MQKITDTIDFLDKEAELYAPEAQPPQFARQMDFNEQQLRRMQLNDQDMAFMNPVGQEGKSGRLVEFSLALYVQRKGLNQHAIGQNNICWPFVDFAERALDEDGRLHFSGFELQKTKP